MHTGSQIGNFPINSLNQLQKTYTDTTGSAPKTASSGRNTATADPSVVISASARQLLESDSVYTLNTSKGDRAIDFNSFFEPPSGPVNLDSIPLLLPTQANVSALQEHISKVLPGVLQQYGIAEAPSEIKFDNQGQMVLPADYPYAEQLKEALAEEPGLMKQLRTVNALASHLVAMQESIAFQQEYTLATSQTEIDAVIAKYHYLFDGSYRPPEVALAFSEDGRMSITADGEPFA